MFLLHISVPRSPEVVSVVYVANIVKFVEVNASNTFLDIFGSFISVIFAGMVFHIGLMTRLPHFCWDGIPYWVND